MEMSKYAPIALLMLVLLAGCGQRKEAAQEIGYVSAPKVTLRDRVAAVYNKVGTVENGERVEILEKRKRLLRIRRADGTEGWIEQRHVASEATFQRFQELARQHAGTVSQGKAHARTEVNMRVEPSRDGDRLYRLNEGDKVELLQRATAPKPAAGAQPVAGQPAMEDWWLVRAGGGRVGWVLSRLVDLDVPLEVAQYAEGQRIVANFVISEVSDDGRQVPQYLMLLSEPRDGNEFDFDQIRVFTWNTARDRYETAYRERKLWGKLPVVTSREDFGKEGTLPVFTIRARDQQGSLSERKYRLNGPIVRRVEPPKAQVAAAPQS
jgi:uncharacterized protein YgiM (DUF1202 family)